MSTDLFNQKPLAVRVMMGQSDRTGRQMSLQGRCWFRLSEKGSPIH